MGHGLPLSQNRRPGASSRIAPQIREPGSLEAANIHGLMRLRAPTDQDASDLESLWQDRQVMRYLGGACDAAASAARFARQLRHWEQHGFGLSVVSADDAPRPAGLCGLSVLTQFPGLPVEMSFMFFPWAWGRGLAFAAASHILDQQAPRLGVSEVVAITQQANTRSQRLLERLEFVKTRSLVMWDEPQYWYVRPATT